jgi:hypothetical protein
VSGSTRKVLEHLAMMIERDATAVPTRGSARERRFAFAGGRQGAVLLDESPVGRREVGRASVSLSLLRLRMPRQLGWRISATAESSIPRTRTGSAGATSRA